MLAEAGKIEVSMCFVEVFIRHLGARDNAVSVIGWLLDHRLRSHKPEWVRCMRTGGGDDADTHRRFLTVTLSYSSRLFAEHVRQLAGISLQEFDGNVSARVGCISLHLIILPRVGKIAHGFDT